MCNNACWTIGEIANRAPQQVKPILKEIIDTLCELLNTDILNKIEKKQEDEILTHFAKTISITLGRLGKVDP
jgi:hypothetical protein